MPFKHSDVIKDTQILTHDGSRLPVFYNEFVFGLSKITIQTYCNLLDSSVSSVFFSQWDEYEECYVHDDTHYDKLIKDELHDRCTIDILFNQHKRLNFDQIIDEALDYYDLDRVI